MSKIKEKRQNESTHYTKLQKLQLQSQIKLRHSIRLSFAFVFSFIFLFLVFSYMTVADYANFPKNISSFLTAASFKQKTKDYIKEICDGFILFPQNAKEVVKEWLGSDGQKSAKQIFVVGETKEEDKTTDEIQLLKAELASLKSPEVKVVQSVTERTIEKIISGITQKDLDDANSFILSRVEGQIEQLKQDLTKQKQETQRRIQGNTQTIAYTQRIDYISSPTITTPAITSPSVSGNASLETLTVSGMASTTDLIISNNFTFGNNTGFLYGTNGAVTASTTIGQDIVGDFWLRNYEDDTTTGKLTVGGLSTTDFTSATTSYVDYLYVNGTATSTFSTGGLTVGTNHFVVESTSGNVGIGDTGPDALLDVKGTVCLDLNADEACTDNTSAISDARLKTNITALTNGLQLVQQLRPVRFTWNGEYNVGTADSNLQVLTKQINLGRSDFRTLMRPRPRKLRLPLPKQPEVE